MHDEATRVPNFFQDLIFFSLPFIYEALWTRKLFVNFSIDLAISLLLVNDTIHLWAVLFLVFVTYNSSSGGGLVNDGGGETVMRGMGKSYGVMIEGEGGDRHRWRWAAMRGEWRRRLRCSGQGEARWMREEKLHFFY